MCGDHARQSLGGALAVLAPINPQTSTSSIDMAGRLEFRSWSSGSPVATHAMFSASQYSHTSQYPVCEEECLVRIHKTGDFTRSIETNPVWASFYIKPSFVGRDTEETDGNRSFKLESKRPLIMEVGPDGIIGRMISVWTHRGEDLVAEGIIGYN